MNKLFLSYNSKMKKYVNEISDFLNEKGGCYELVYDSDEDMSSSGNFVVWINNVEDKLHQIDGIIILIGKDTHSPRKTLEQELSYAIKMNLPVFGIRIPGENGETPEKIKDYMRYFEVGYDFNELLNELNKELPC